MLVVLAAVGALVYWLATQTRAGQDVLLERALSAAINAGEPLHPDSLHVFICGSASPLPAPGRAQACVAIVAGDGLYLVDAGSGSAAPLALVRTSAIVTMRGRRHWGPTNRSISSEL